MRRAIGPGVYGLLIYFGWPHAHENDTERAIYTGLGIAEAMSTLNTRLQAAYGVELAVRIGVHTGPVVVGEIGGGGRHENLALGETPKHCGAAGRAGPAQYDGHQSSDCIAGATLVRLGGWRSDD